MTILLLLLVGAVGGNILVLAFADLNLGLLWNSVAGALGGLGLALLAAQGPALLTGALALGIAAALGGALLVLLGGLLRAALVR